MGRMKWSIPDGHSNCFEAKIARAVLRSKTPRKTMVDKLLFAHGWRRNSWRGGGWIPPGWGITFGSPITVESLRNHGFNAVATQLLGIENTLVNWIEIDCARRRDWYQSFIPSRTGEEHAEISG
jgi:hypothetical protein